jgi:hypothetical protein
MVEDLLSILQGKSHKRTSVEPNVTGPPAESYPFVPLSDRNRHLLVEKILLFLLVSIVLPGKKEKRHPLIFYSWAK